MERKDRYSIRIIISLICIILVSCEKVAYKGRGTLQPEFEIDMNYGQDDGTWHWGINELKRYNDVLIANTTLRLMDSTGGLDNRLCAIDLKTKEPLWFFPKDVEQRYSFNFDGNGHLYKNKLVFRYYDTPRLRDNSIVCINVETGDEKWRIEDTRQADSPILVRDVEGFERYSYFIHNEKNIYCADLENDTYSVIKEYTGYDVNKIEFTSDKNLMVFYSTSERLEPGYDIKHNHVDILDKDTYEVTFTYSLETDIILPLDRWFPIQGGIEKDGVLYLWSYCYNSAVDISSGEMLWERCDNFTYGPNVHLLYNNILLKCAVNATVAYDIHTGEIIYGEDNYGCWNATLYGKYVYLFNRVREIDVIDIETGEIVDYIKCKYQNKGEKFWGSYPTVLDNKLYILSDTHLFRYPLYPWK